MPNESQESKENNLANKQEDKRLNKAKTDVLHGEQHFQN